MLLGGKTSSWQGIIWQSDWETGARDSSHQLTQLFFPRGRKEAGSSARTTQHTYFKKNRTKFFDPFSPFPFFGNESLKQVVRMLPFHSPLLIPPFSSCSIWKTAWSPRRFVVTLPQGHRLFELRRVDLRVASHREGKVSRHF